MTHPFRLILASASPRRRELLTQAGLEFDVVPANIEESPKPGEVPASYVQRLALEKALAVSTLYPDATVLAADTTVVLAGEVLNKPNDIQDAERMLRALSGCAHQVHTGIALVHGPMVRQHVEATTVYLTAIPEDDLVRYLATGDSLDKAGAYGIQGYAARWVKHIEGDFFNVMGLPIASTVRLLAEF